MELMIGGRTSAAISDWLILQFSHLPNRRKLSLGYKGRDHTMDLILFLLCILVGGGTGDGGH